MIVKKLIKCFKIICKYSLFLWMLTLLYREQVISAKSGKSHIPEEPHELKPCKSGKVNSEKVKLD